MYLKRRIVIDDSGRPVKFAMVMYPSEKDATFDNEKDIFGSLGCVIGYLTSYEKAERLEMYFNESIENFRKCFEA